MSTRAKHKADCLHVLGNDFNEVHAWLDGLSYKTWPSVSHRRWRHHRQALEEIRRMFGDEAVKAAELHIKDDFGFIPEDEAQVILWLKSNGWKHGEEEDIQNRVAKLEQSNNKECKDE